MFLTIGTPQAPAGIIQALGQYGGYQKFCMTLSTLYLGNNRIIVYYGHAGFFSINSRKGQGLRFNDLVTHPVSGPCDTANGEQSSVNYHYGSCPKQGAHAANNAFRGTEWDPCV